MILFTPSSWVGEADESSHAHERSMGRAAYSGFMPLTRCPDEYRLTVSEDGTAAWHRRLHHTQGGTLSEDTAQTTGMRRYEAISGKRNGSRKIWMGESRIAPGMVSGDHHHGESETGIYVVSGNPAFVFLENDAERRVETSPGDYIYVPPYVPHREENRGDEPATVVLARSTQEGIVVNLPSLRAHVPELDAIVDEHTAGA
jgi:uncharacterized RmlC-like cupin family protein